MAVFLRMCRITAGNRLNPVRLDLTRSRPACAGEFDRVFRAAVEFNAADNRLCFDRDNTSMQVRTRIIEQLPAGTPRQDSIAGEVNISLRSMQRKLKEEGNSFNGLFDNTRHELAMYYIRETHRHLGEIAYLLGFSEPSSFTRAFRRWMGVTPQEFRDNAGS